MPRLVNLALQERRKAAAKKRKEAAFQKKVERIERYIPKGFEMTVIIDDPEHHTLNDEAQGHNHREVIHEFWIETKPRWFFVPTRVVAIFDDKFRSISCSGKEVPDWIWCIAREMERINRDGRKVKITHD